MATIDALSKPASPEWCMARVAALLNPYYDKDTPPAVRKMEAEDWLEELQFYPQWAIESAVRWWKSADNINRRKKPLEGDISERCKLEMRGIGSLPKILERKASNGWFEPQLPRLNESKQERQAIAEKILSDAGFKLKRMQEDLQ